MVNFDFGTKAFVFFFFFFLIFGKRNCNSIEDLNFLSASVSSTSGHEEFFALFLLAKVETVCLNWKGTTEKFSPIFSFVTSFV